MSLARMMLRAAVVQALKGCTIAGDRVFDTRMGALQVDNPDDYLPAICVYTESDRREQITPGDAARVFRRSIEVQLEVTLGSYSSTTVAGPQGNPEQQQVYTVMETDPDIEAVLDLFEHQIVFAIRNDTGRNHALLNMVKCTDLWESIPGRTKPDEGNNKISARQINMIVQVKDDCLLPIDGAVITPGPPGSTIFPPLEQVAPHLIPLLQDLANTPTFAPLADMLRTIYGTKAIPPPNHVDAIGWTLKPGVIP